MLKTLIANLKHALVNRQSVEIGGGLFSPDEIREALKQYAELQAAAAQALDALEWDVGGEPMPTSELAAVNSLRAALRHVV